MAVSQDDLDAAALEPAKIQGEQGSVENRPVEELRQAQKARAADAGASKAHRGLRFSQVQHGGSR
jgi:hypothetical protein